MKKKPQRGCKSCAPRADDQRRKNRLWGKHQTAMKSDTEEKEKYTEASKKEKGEMALLWLLKKSTPSSCTSPEKLKG